MLEGRGRHGKFNGILGRLSAEQGVNQSAGEAVPAAYPVHNMQMIFL